MHRNCRKVLRRIVLDFNREHHGLPSQLQYYRLSILDIALADQRGIGQGLSKHPSLSDTVWELVQAGYLTSTDSLIVSLTKAGLAEGSRNRLQRCYDFVDRSPGVAVLISFAALITAIVALVVE